MPAGGIFPSQLTVAGNQLFFVGRMLQGSDYELFVSDGTVGGARLVKDIWPGGFSSQITFPVALGNKLVFAAGDPTNGNEIWVSDGTEAGTILLRDIYPGAAGSSPSFLTVVGNRVVFAANDQVIGLELWVTDGTPAGTQLLKDINVGPGFGVAGSQNTFATVGRFALFVGNTAATGFEPWITDGTTAGTVLLRDVNPGTDPSMPTSNPLSPGFTVTRIGDNQIWFAANDGQSGTELWRTDGTAAGTRLVADVGSGGAGSNPERMMLLGQNVVFAASTTALGQEPYVAPAGANAVSVGQGCAGGGRQPRLTATDPLLGRTQRIDGSGALVGTTGALVLGAVANPPLSTLGCTFWFDLGVHIVLPPFAVTQSSWTQSLFIPNNPSLGRTGLALQALCLPTDGPLGFDLTNGVLSSPGN